VLEYRISNKEYPTAEVGPATAPASAGNRGGLPSYFDIHYSLFDILRFKMNQSRPKRQLAAGHWFWARSKEQEASSQRSESGTRSDV
jgi:hypothetical protein